MGVERSTFLIDAQGRVAARMAQGQGAGPRRGSPRRRRRALSAPRRCRARAELLHSIISQTHNGASIGQPQEDDRTAPRVRPRHERHDARPLGHLPVRGTRHIHPDDRARGTRRRQERDVGSRAQCAPGEPLPRRADGDGRQGAHRSGPGTARGEIHAGRQETAERPACSSRPGSLPADCPTRCPATAPTTRSSRRRSRCRNSIRTRSVTLVSKDINLRIKAAILGVHAEDYYSDKTIEDADLLYTGVEELPANFWDRDRPQARVVARTGRPEFLSRSRQTRRQLGAEPVRLPGRRSRHRGGRAAHRRRLRRAGGGAGLSQRASRRLGHQRAQPRAEFRVQPAARSRRSIS